MEEQPLKILADTAEEADHVKVAQAPPRSAKRDRAPTNNFVPTMETDQPRAEMPALCTVSGSPLTSGCQSGRSSPCDNSL